MIYKYFLPVFVFTILFFLILLPTGCKNKTQASEKIVSANIDLIKNIESEYTKNPNDTTFIKLMNSYGANISKSQNIAEKEQLLDEVLKWTEKTANNTYEEIFAEEMLKVNPNHPAARRHLFLLGEYYKEKEDNEAASLFFEAYSKRFPDDPKKSFADMHILTYMQNKKNYFKDLGNKVLEKPDTLGVNYRNAVKFIMQVENFSLSFPEDEKVPVYLSKAIDLTRTIQEHKKMINLADWLINYYPDKKETPDALFSKAVTIDNIFNMPDLARENFELFLSRYPNHPLAKDVKGLIDLQDKKLNLNPNVPKPQ